MHAFKRTYIIREESGHASVFCTETLVDRDLWYISHGRGLKDSGRLKRETGSFRIVLSFTRGTNDRDPLV